MQVGDIRVDAVSDGAFVARPSYFGADLPAGTRPDVFARDGAAWLPIGCFVVRTGDRVVLVDAGMGPDRQRLPDRMLLVGGQLLTGLRALDVAPDEVTDVVCTHLHADHVGWLFDLDAVPVFPAARIWLGAGDWQHFVTGPGEMAPHIRAGFRSTGSRRLRSLDGDATVAPGVTALLTPGHTPGHLCVSVTDGGQRLILLGDSITCPVQLDEPGWRSMGDVDPELAHATRERLWQELADGRTRGVGAHFPELAHGRVTGTTRRRWVGP
jgi:glyoxylase-like metal-dependent hydrolase (beta-lactamase superfamily II)